MALAYGIISALLVVLTCSGGTWAGWASLAGRLRLRGGSSNLEGVVETFIYDEWRMVCGQNWTQEPANAVCRQLGHRGGAAEARVVATPSGLFSEAVLVDLVSCASEQVADCDDFVSSGDDWCDPSEVAWVRCARQSPVDLFPVAQALKMDSLRSGAGLKPVASDVGGGSVTLDWSDWYREIDMESLFLVRFVIMYHIADNDASMEYRTAGETRSYDTRYTVRGLKERTRYEFIVKGVRLGLDGEELGPSTSPVVVIMPCGAPSQVSKPAVWPKNGTGRAVELSWERPPDPDCPPSSYLVEFQLKSLGQCGEQVQMPDSISVAGNTTKTDFTLGGLRPHSTYAVYVTSRNQHGTSQAWQGTVTTNEDAPSVVPTGIRSKYVDETKLRFSWDPIPCEERDGTITGYSYILLDVTTDEVTSTGHTVLPTVNVTGVQAVRRYKFLVAARTKAGRGPYAAFSVDAQPKLSDICGRTAHFDPSRGLTRQAGIQRIVSGTGDRKGSTPWLAQIWYVTKGTLFCHGSVIDNRWILTAAHCIRSKNVTKNDIVVRLGDFDKSLPEEEEQAYRVDEINVHANFDTKLFDADVAVIKLDRPIQFTEYVRPICMPSKSVAKSMLTVGRRGVVAGWGKLASGDNDYPRFLKTVTLPVKDQSTCRRSTNYEVTPNMFCAGYSRAGMGDSCEGDSGSPFTVQRTNNRWYILGIVSWGEGCDRMDKYGFYVRLHRYIAWIRKKTGIKFS